MEICFVEDTLLHGGTQIWVTEAVRAFLSLGERVTVLTPETGWVSERCAQTGARVVTYNWHGIVDQDDRGQSLWTGALRGSDVALCTVHPPRGGFHCVGFAAKCIRDGGLDTHLVAKTGTVVPEYRREFYLPDESISCSVIAIADFTRSYLLDAYGIPSDRVVHIYQGVDIRRFRSTEEGKVRALARYPLPAGAGPILGCIGAFEHRKGQRVLLEAMSRLVSGSLPGSSGSLPGAHLVLAGDGPDNGDLCREVEARDLASRVSFLPFTSEPETLFERIDITVLPSLYKEGLPNVLLESMAMGVPVVASRVGGVPEVVQESLTGIIVEPGNSEQLARAIHRLWADPAAYLRMGRNGRRLMEQSFDKEVQYRFFLKEFERLCR
jgi:glycosyltransferase involved in cell wall biosynthesis